MLPSFAFDRVVVFAVGVALALAGCAKKTNVAKTVPARPPPPAPSASLAASPDDLQGGQSTTLTWNTENASRVSISGVGSVRAKASTTIRPQSSTTYVLTATGP